MSDSVPPRVLPAGEVPARVPVPIVSGRIPPDVQPVGEVPERATAGGRHAAPPGVDGIHLRAAFAHPSRVTVTYGSVI